MIKDLCFIHHVLYLAAPVPCVGLTQSPRRPKGLCNVSRMDIECRSFCCYIRRETHVYSSSLIISLCCRVSVRLKYSYYSSHYCYAITFSPLKSKISHFLSPSKSMYVSPCDRGVCSSKTYQRVLRISSYSGRFRELSYNE